MMAIFESLTSLTLAVPLTRDRGSLAELAGKADISSVFRCGTALGAALALALETLEGRAGRRETVLLPTDGDDREGRGLSVAESCRERGITVHYVGFGSPLVAKIPVGEGGGEVFLRDRSGRDVVSVMDAGGLRAIADATGGTLLDVAEGDEPLVALYEDRIFEMARRPFGPEERRERENRFQWLMLAAFLLWNPALLSERRTAQTPLLPLLLMGCGGESGDAAPEYLYNRVLAASFDAGIQDTGADP